MNYFKIDELLQLHVASDKELLAILKYYEETVIRNLTK